MSDRPFRTVQVTLTVPVRVAAATGIQAATDPAKLGQVLAADSWRGGRYPFTQEQIVEGLRSEVRAAVIAAVEDYMARKYGTAEYVETSGEGWACSTPKYLVESAKWTQDDLKYVEVQWDERKVTVTTEE